MIAVPDSKRIEKLSLQSDFVDDGVSRFCRRIGKLHGRKKRKNREENEAAGNWPNSADCCYQEREIRLFRFQKFSSRKNTRKRTLISETGKRNEKQREKTLKKCNIYLSAKSEIIEDDLGEFWLNIGKQQFLFFLQLFNLAFFSWELEGCGKSSGCVY